ncbi:hypothetical protein D9613_004713 [Agrocybe pediades]|uniref:Uncharacterized protein n=1 Tax=Agrocybe pediades TaxID=84607 RepID=A0A8H4QYV2_9AGAR|nr:hypothetical protein D9613_004713 [Agrocybe pediades]
MNDCTIPDASTSSSSPAARYIPSDLEARCYYRGVSATPPRLIYRTDLSIRPWVMPGPFWEIPTPKRANGVFGHKLNELWEDKVSPKVQSFLNDERVDWSSVELVRFISYQEEPYEEIKGPVVIWIGVRPVRAEEQGDQIHRATQHILELLKLLDIDDVTVEYRASTYRLLNGTPLLPSEDDIRYITYLRDESIELTMIKLRTPLTHALGLSISSTDTPEVEGTMAVYMKMGDEMLGLTCRHTLFKSDSHDASTNQDSSSSEPDSSNTSPHKNVQVLSTPALTRLVKDVESRIDTSRRMLRRELGKMEELVADRWKPRCDSENDSEPKPDDGSGSQRPSHTIAKDSKDDDKLERCRKEVAKRENDINVLNKFLEKVKNEYGTPEQRTIGRMLYSPKLEPNVDDSGFFEDWALFKLNKDQFKTQFRGNVIDLDAKISLGEFLKKMYSLKSNQPDPEVEFQYPLDRLLVLNDIMSKELLLTHNMRDEHDEPCLLVIKSRSASGVTVGRATGSFALVRDEETGKVSKQWAIYNYYEKRDRSYFAECGDSGSVVVDRNGRIGGMIVGGSGCWSSTLMALKKGEADEFDVHVTYATPMWWIMDRVKAKYPDVELVPGVSFDDALLWRRSAVPPPSI